MTNGEARTPWETPQLTFEGNLHEIVLGGTGKTTSPAGDPGEPAKAMG